MLAGDPPQGLRNPHRTFRRQARLGVLASGWFWLQRLSERGFAQGMQLQDAEALVKGKRSQAHPYIDCWKVGVVSRLNSDFAPGHMQL